MKTDIVQDMISCDTQGTFLNNKFISGILMFSTLRLNTNDTTVQSTFDVRVNLTY